MGEAERAELRRRMRQILDVLLDTAAPPERLAAAVGELESILCSIHGVRSAVEDETQRYRLQGKHGQVISPGYAVSTMQDAIRTAKYVRALLAAIEASRNRLGGARVHVLYAGPGPQAPFFVLPALFFGADQLAYTLVEILPTNCAALRQVIDVLGLEGHVTQLIHGDAVEYRHEGEPYHVVVLEIMQRALGEEPQVAACVNLVDQLAPEGVLIPECIELRAVLCNESLELSHRSAGRAPDAALAERRALGVVFRVTRESCRELKARAHERTPRVSRVPIPEMLSAARQLAILTEIRLFGATTLHEGESGLCAPVYLSNLGPLRGGQTLHTEYVFGALPGLRCQLVSPPPRVSTHEASTT